PTPSARWASSSPESRVSSTLAGPSDSASAARSSRIRCRATGGGRLPRRCLRRWTSGWASATARRNSSSSSGGEPIEVLFRVQRGHAAAAGAGDGLAVDVVLHVAGGEDSLHAGGARHAL